jgi:leucyl aminopeptidase
MPLAPELREVLESDIADLKNVGNRFGGSITAALFLRDFVARDLPWAHLDIAGPVWATSDSGYVAKGGTGYGVRTLVELVTVLEAAEESEA